MAKKRGNPNWVKGKSGNPTGPKPGLYRQLLHKALAADKKKHKKHLLEYAVEKARTDTTVLNAILKKVLPDLKSIEAKLDTESPFRLILEYASTGASDTKADKQGKETIDRDNSHKPAHLGSGSATGNSTSSATGQAKSKTCGTCGADSSPEAVAARGAHTKSDNLNTGSKPPPKCTNLDGHHWMIEEPPMDGWWCEYCTATVLDKPPLVANDSLCKSVKVKPSGKRGTKTLRQMANERKTGSKTDSPGFHNTRGSK